MSPKMRRAVLLLALPLAAFAAWEANENDDPGRREVLLAAPAQADPPPANSSDRPLPRLDLHRLDNLARRHGSAQPPVDPFASPGGLQGPAAEPAAVVAPAAPPAPQQAPPLPFRYIGREEAGAVQVIFLEHEEQVHIVRIGENVGEGWRLDAVGDEQLTFTYLPLGQQRAMPLGSAG